MPFLIMEAFRVKFSCETKLDREASMIKNSTQPKLLQKLFELLERHRSAFQQERVYWRAVGMVLGEIFNFGRHTVTQGLMALGVIDGDWSGWYRLFSQGRYEERKVAQVFFRETLEHTVLKSPMWWESMECKYREAV